MGAPSTLLLGLGLCAVFAAPACAASVGSIGAVLRSDPDNGELVVRSVPDGLAAAEAGLEEGDRIKMIDGVLVDGMKKAKLQSLLRGEVGSSVELTVVRGEHVVRLVVTRQAILERAPGPAKPAPAEHDGAE